MKILLVEDNLLLAKSLIKYLELKWIDADYSQEGNDGLYKASVNYYDVIVLDIGLPNIDGLSICNRLREKWVITPIIILTSRGEKKDIVVGLNTWADDYMSKPFDNEELIARLNSLSRRTLKNKSNHIKVKEYTIDLEAKEVKKDNEKIKLSSLEFDLFKYMAQNKGKVIDRQELYEKVWGEFDNYMFSKTIDVYIWYLRKKLGNDIIETRKWQWYLVLDDN